jgi:hypothetical protein
MTTGRLHVRYHITVHEDANAPHPATTPSSGAHSTECGWIVNTNATSDIDADPDAAWAMA